MVRIFTVIHENKCHRQWQIQNMFTGGHIINNVNNLIKHTYILH